MGNNFSFAIVSDIHVKSSGEVHEAFRQVVQILSAMGPRFVVLSGDATVGNPNDGVGDAKVSFWWQSLREAMSPLPAAGIPILPIAGNHDYYTSAHRRGYATAWKDLESEVSALTPLSGKPPLSYSFVLDDVFFLFLHVVDQDIEDDVAAFAQAELASAAAQGARLRLCFGHVPLISIMGKTSQRFLGKLGKLLAAGGVAAYFSGHEHLFWDQLLDIPDSQLQLRQIHVGTSSGCYHFPLSQSVYSTYCQGETGRIPFSGLPFALLPGSRQQKDGVNVVMVNVHPDDGDAGYDIQPLALRDGMLVPFGS
jgi:3',5'-cyclic AMP phosphodiesterase CpdA